MSYCLELAEMGIFLAAWLAATVRTELNRFVEFMHFLRYGTRALSTSMRAVLFDEPYFHETIIKRRVGVTETPQRYYRATMF